MVEGTPPGDALLPPPQRATLARKGARCGPGAGSPRPHRPHTGHTGHGTPAARSRGRAAGGGTAPDTRRPSQRWQANPPGDGPPPPPRHAAPTGHASQGGGVGPPHPHGRARSSWVADPNSPPSGRAVGRGKAPDLRRPSQWWKAPPPGDALPPPPQRATLARKGARCGAGAGSPRPHRPHPGHTGHGTPTARSRGQGAGGGTAPDTRRPSQRWQASPPGDATPAACSPHRACRPRGQCWAPTPTHPRPQHVGGGPQQPAPVGGQSGEGQRLASDAPHNDGRHPPGDALPPPPQRATPGRRGARCGAGDGSPRPHRPRPGHRVAEPWLPTPVGGRPGEGQRLTPGAPHNGGRHPPGGRPSTTPTASNAGPQGRTLWDRCWVPTPAPTAPGTHGSRNPGCPLHRTGGRGRDSA